MHRTPYYDPPPPPMCTYLLDAPYSNRFPNTGARWAVRKTDWLTNLGASLSVYSSPPPPPPFLVHQDRPFPHIRPISVLASGAAQARSEQHGVRRRRRPRGHHGVCLWLTGTDGLWPNIWMGLTMPPTPSSYVGVLPLMMSANPSIQNNCCWAGWWFDIQSSHSSPNF